MSSKVSKSEKTKLKFAQSNINHVYRGNTAEPHHKPTVRQYGMQVVGKVQGTRRLPPPAWVPSIKAETGGLDSRVSIVPPGGSGWGAPTESRPTTGTDTTAEVGSTAVAAPPSSLNGSLSREAIGTSFEPAYARSLGSKSGAPTNETPQTGIHSDSSPTDGLNAKVSSHGTVATVGNTTASSGTLSQSTAWASRTQTTVASGGLAANKPFFQRPPPVTSSATTTTPSTKTEERKPLTTQAGGGASEIVGEPTGWAAVTEEEPNFDERILFSDEEESQEDSKSTLKSSTSVRVTAQSDVTSTASASAVVPPAKQSTPNLGSFTDSESASRTEPNRPYSSSFGCMSSSAYTEAQREKAPDTWSNAEIPSSFTGYDLPAVGRLPTTLSFANPALGTHCSTNTEGERMLTVGQYMQPPIPSQGVNPGVFTDPYFPNQIATSRIGGSGSGLLESILPPTDAETELQNAQRQARTQEFRSAVERARISRHQREVFSTEGDSLLQKSVVNLISEPCDTSHTHTAQTANQSMLLSPGHSIVPPVLGGVIPQQLLLPNAYQQGTGQNRPTLSATAAAMVCGTSGAPARLSTPVVAPSLVKVLHSQAIPVSSHSAANLVGSWQGPASLPPNIPTSAFNTPKPPTVPQVLQSALSMATSGAPGAHPNGVYLNPDFFVERLLEILKQQQVVRPQSNPQPPTVGRNLHQSTEAVAPNPSNESGLVTQTGQVGTPNKGPFGEGPFTDSDLTELSQQLETTLKTESPNSVQNAVTATADQASVNSSMGKQQQQQQTKRVPGLMDVKVPTSTSRNLAYLWEQDDYLCGPSVRGGRGRSKLFTSEKSRGGSRGRRPGGRFASDDISIVRMNSGDHRSVVNQSGSQDDYDGTSNVHSWRSKTSSRRVFNGPKSEAENPLTNSDIQLEVAHSSRSDNKPSYGSEPEEYTERTESFQDNSTAAAHRFDASANAFESSTTHRQNSSGTKQRGKPTYNDVQEGEPNGQRRNDYSRQHERVRRGRGGSGFYYSNSRTFNNEEGSNKYAYNAEQKPYTRITRGGGSAGGSGTYPTRSHRSVTSTAHSESNTRRRNLEEASGEALEQENRSGHVHAEEYQPQRLPRDNRYHDREWRSHEPLEDKSYQKGRGHSRTLDIRRSSAYRDEYNFSDGEPRTADNKHSQTRQYHSNQRNRSHDDQRYSQKGSSRQNASSHTHEIASSQSAEVGENQSQPVKDKPASYDLPVEEYGEGDLPTVRVPPMDTAFKSSRSQYTRANRSTTFQRGSGLRRIAPNRTGGTQQQQQQTKRSTGSNMQGSRRYRDLQNRYRDDKDGDGGAAAGGGGSSSGTGRSAEGGNGTNMHGSGGSSGTNGVSDLGDNQNSGGTHNKGSSNDSVQDRDDRSTSYQHAPTEKPKSLLPNDAESNENNTADVNADIHRLPRHVSGTSGPSEGHGVHAAAGVRGRKDRATNVSASGGRPSGGQGFRRQGFIRSGHAATSRPSATASIPPLMSITPEGPFTHVSHDFDTVFNSDTRTTYQPDNATEKTTKPSVVKTANVTSAVRSTLPDSSAEDPEDHEFLSDGFTKVVSKSSKKQARKRLQMELSAAVATTPNTTQKPGTRRLEDAKFTGAHLKQSLNDRGLPRSDRSPHSSVSVRLKNPESTPPIKQFPSKTKPFPVKPTFMGPPMCLANGKLIGVTESDHQVSAAVVAHGFSRITKSHQPISAIQGVGSDNTVQTSAVSNANTGRTWSKVVGTKAPSCGNIAKDAGSDKSTSPKSQDSVWLTKHQLTDQKTDIVTSNGATTENRNTKIGITEPIKPVWSTSASGDDKETLRKMTHTASEQTNVTPAVPSVSITSTNSSTTTNTTISLANSTVVTNVCKVRPQQQQPSPQVGTTSSALSSAPNAPVSNVTPLSPISGGQEQNSALGTCSGDLNAMENDRIDCNFDTVVPQGRSVARQIEDGSNHALVSNRPVQSSWTEGLPTQIPGNYFEGRMGYENPFSPNTWPVTDIDPNRGTNIPSHYGQLTSDGIFASPSGASVSTDLPNKPTHAVALAPRHQPYSVQPYSHTSAATADAQHIPGVYGSSLGDAHKLSSANPLSQPPHTAFTPMGGSMYVAPQQPSSNPQSQQTGSFTAGWTVPSNAQGIAHGPRFRQRIAHQLDISSFNGYPFPAEIPNEYTFLPSATACVPAPPSGGLYSAMQGQHQSNYHHGSTRSTLGSSGTAPWSLLANSSGSGGMQVSNTDYSGGLPSAPVGSAGGSANGGTGGGLLPHPVAQGFSNAAAPISSSPGSTYMTHPNYVGVIGGGRPSSNDLPGASGRQRGLPQGLYPAHNLAHSPSAQGQQQFQLHSTFYSSLSPSHQRVHLQQFPGAQGRNSIHNFANPQNSLYATTYGPPPTQPTPPPLHSQMGYPNNFSAESTVAPPGAFHSNVQSHSFSNLGLQPTHPHVHGHRSLQSTGPQIVSRNLGAVNNHGGSALVIPGAVGPSGVSALPGYPQPTPPAPLSVSGYPLKPILPTL